MTRNFIIRMKSDTLFDFHVVAIFFGVSVLRIYFHIYEKTDD